ncbi:MAG: DNA/RNA non-specific endonuclease [Paraprevotella sp.]|nr:DNA/RNA non-specific endonuclease [Paraprevotella sp.]
MKRTAILFACLTSLCVLFGCNNDEDSPSTDNTNANANPSVIPNATNLEIPRLDDQTGDLSSHYVTYQGKQVLNYTLDWHKDKKHSRWVAFVFTSTTSGTSWNRNNWKGAEWGGNVWTGDPFQPDPDIPVGERSELSDFRGSGYDRGHLCASADRLLSQDANGETFYLSNMSPQMGPFNQDDWVNMEGQIQNWGRNNNFRDTLFVVKGGTIADGQTMGTIGSGIVIPKYYFAALLCKKYENGLNTYKAIGFWVEHKSYGGHPDLRSWVVSIDELEEKTGIDFFCNLPDRIETPVERTYNIESWTGL